MKLYSYTVLFLIGIASLFSGLYNDIFDEIILGLFPPIFIGYAIVFFMIKHSNSSLIELNKMLIQGFSIKFIFYGVYIITIFTVYSFKPIPFMCSFATSFIVLHILEAVILKKIKLKVYSI